MVILNIHDVWPVAVLESKEVFAFTTGYHEAILNGHKMEKYFERSKSKAYREFKIMDLLPRRNKKIK